MLDVLIVGAHPDDAEIGMGGAIASFVAQGLSVGILDVTDGEPTPRGTPERRAREAAEAARRLGVVWRRTLDIPNRYVQDTIGNRRKLAEVMREVRPRIVFGPYWEDAHPDHIAVSRLVDAARFYAKLTKTDMAGEPYYPPKVYYYFCNHWKLHPQPAFILDVSDTFETKMAALRAYESQLVEGRPDPEAIFETIRVRGRYWGHLLGVRYGEPFTTREPVGLRSLRDVVF